MAKYYYYQQIDNIGKQIALVRSRNVITDTAHYRDIPKEYYEEVVAFLREQNKEVTDNEV